MPFDGRGVLAPIGCGGECPLSHSNNKTSRVLKSIISHSSLETGGPMAKRSPTSKDIGLLHQLFKNNQLTLAPEFQRNAIWPRVAKAYLIDTILNDRPIPLLFFQRAASAQTGLPSYAVIDGQQRLRAIFEFIDDRFRLATGPKKTMYSKKRFSELPPSLQKRILNYDLVVEELSGYSENDIRDMFVRINRYVVQLSPQELRHAKGSGKFHNFVEDLGRDTFWKTGSKHPGTCVGRDRTRDRL
jgi:hypothetical protein